jgi:hypothetical protein
MGESMGIEAPLHADVDVGDLIDAGSSSNCSQDVRATELAIVDHSSADHDDVTVIADSALHTGKTINRTVSSLATLSSSFNVCTRCSPNFVATTNSSLPLSRRRSHAMPRSSLDSTSGRSPDSPDRHPSIACDL